MPRDRDETPGADAIGTTDTLVETAARRPESSGTLAGVGPAAGTPSPSAGHAPRLSLPQYELRQLLGRGGMGDVVLAKDKTIGRSVAIKQLRREASEEDVARFLREARIQARLEHPAILPVYQIGQDSNGQPYFTMKRLTGTTFADQLNWPTPPPRQRMLRFFSEACKAIEFAHSRGVVHRDLKPSNIMVGDFGEVYVLDWGLARIEGEMSSERGSTEIGADVESIESSMTQAGSMLGTPGYMAPEQIEDASKVGPAADVYALGSILFELLVSESLHPRGRGAIANTLKGVEERPSQRKPQANVPPELDELCIQCLATDPAARPSVKHLAERLEGYLDGDRDVERRRELAAHYVNRARDAMALGDVTRRAEAMQYAGRALALDPQSVDAGALVTRLTFEPSRDYPEQLRKELTAGEVAVQKKQGRAAMGSFVIVLLYLAIAATNGVWNLPFVLAIVGYLAVHASIVWRITQKQASVSQMIWVAFANSLLAALLSRTLGSLIVVPAVTCIMALQLTSYPQLIDRKWTVITLLVASWVTPVILEQLGVLAPTWEVVGRNVVLSSHVMAIGGLHTAILLVFSNIATFVVFGLFACKIATSRRDAMQRAEIQAWHLRQLLPAAPKPPKTVAA
jgi:eukaryotic-like serine/threonine-protein kinase